MANYTTQMVLLPDGLTVDAKLKKALELVGATVSKDGIYFEDGFLFEPDDSQDEEIERYLNMDEAALFREVLKQNPQTDHIVASYANTCSKMCSDGFGGGALFITLTHFLWINDASARISNGQIVVSAEPTAFEENV